MLNSTKTWQEDFDEQFIDVIVFDSKGSYYKKFKEGVELINIYKFISDLRKKDEEELIVKGINFLEENRHSWAGSENNKIKFRQLIKDYYEN